LKEEEEEEEEEGGGVHVKCPRQVTDKKEKR
jgi:hypothetical protein